MRDGSTLRARTASHRARCRPCDSRDASRCMLVVALLAACASDAPQASPRDDAGRASSALVRRGGGSSVSRWSDRTDAAAPAPPAGEDCTAIYDPDRHRLVLFAGKTDADVNVNEVWEFDLEHETWQQVHTTGDPPPPREDHVAIHDPVGHRMIVHGGEDGLTSNKTFALDLQTACWRDLTDAASPAREDHTAVYDGKRRQMIVFGGRHADGKTDHVDNDVWALDLDPASKTFEHWHQLAVEGTPPLGRTDHAAVFDPHKDRMLVYGGYNKEKRELLGDTWALCLGASSSGGGHWQQIKTRHSWPPRRRHVVGVLDTARNWFVICGGFGEEGYLNDVWALDLAADVWVDITPGPQPRLDHQAIFDPRGGRLVVYGGDARLGHKFHDLWALQIEPDMPLQPMLRAASSK
jgi:hypothetical protein